MNDRYGSAITFRTSWRIDHSDKVPDFEEDGGLSISETQGSVYFPLDYREFITKYPGGVTPTEDDNFIIAQFVDEPIEVQLDYLFGFEDVVFSCSSNYESIYAEESKSRLPPKHVIITSGSIDDFVINVDRENANFGKVYNWTRASDPWGIGDNTEGLGC